jgi:hypothetical protein
MTAAFIVTIDTEGDNPWARKSGPVETKNVCFLPRFQRLCERYRLRPTYVTTHEIALDPAFVAFGRDIVARDAGEIGTHPHAWNSPPIVPLTRDDDRYHPYMTEYPVRVMEEKLRALTGKLEDTFGVKMVSHRAGRWGFDPVYANLLYRLGYRVDCSVTPLISWASSKGAPAGKGGPNYTRFPGDAYFPDENDISRRGALPLLEVPLTVRPKRGAIFRKWFPQRLYAHEFSQYWIDRLCPVVWMRPSGRNLTDLLWLVEREKRRGSAYIEFMLHSCELMPGGSPVFPGARSIEKLYDDMEILFETATRYFSGTTLKEFHEHNTKRIDSSESHTAGVQN